MSDHTIFDIKIKNNGEVVINSDNNGIKLNKVTTLQYFLSTFGQSFATFETPLIPMFCRKIIKSGNSELYIFEFPAIHRDLRYKNTLYEKVPCPRSLVALKISVNSNQKSVSKISMYSLDQLVSFDLNMNLYSWPFNNYSSSGWICWGNKDELVRNIVNDDSVKYSSLFNIYMSTNFNNHLEPNINYNIVSKYEGDQMLKIINLSKDTGVFPLSVVNKSEETIGGIIAGFQDGTY